MELLAASGTSKGPKERFTGDIYLDMIVDHAPAGFSVAKVRFTPGAHTAWHSHPAGQALHCVEGLGLVVTEDEVIVLRPGATVWTPPGVRHWHGAAPDHFMAHLAMGAISEEGAALWAEHVPNDAYLEAAARVA